jgi:hypothetical protein
MSTTPEDNGGEGETYGSFDNQTFLHNRRDEPKKSRGKMTFGSLHTKAKPLNHYDVTI